MKAISSFWKKLTLPAKIVFVFWTIGVIGNMTSKEHNYSVPQILAVWIAGCLIYVGLAQYISRKLQHKSKDTENTSISDKAYEINQLTKCASQTDVFHETVTQHDKEVAPFSPSATSNEDIVFPEWYISLSFGKSTSSNYDKAVVLAKAAPQYHEQIDNGNILHQAIYSSKPSEYLSFIMLYELVGGWKSSFVIINGKLTDRKIVGKLNYCYGDRCRSGNSRFCYGASYMTENPFGCHRLQISATNTPWWSFYEKQGRLWVLNKVSMKGRIDSYAAIYQACPAFDYDNIISELEKLPSVLSGRQMERLSDDNFGCKM